MNDGALPHRPALALAALGAVAALLLGGVHLLTRDRISEAEQRRALDALTGLLPDSAYDNDLLDDRIEVRIPGLAGESTVYRARLDGRPVALVADVVTERGYSGTIRLLVALEAGGVVEGVRVVEHSETPGLGDRIEVRRSDWIEQFGGTSLGDPPIEEWKPDRRGGAFDTLSSATITSAAVIGAVRAVLDWYASNRRQAFEDRHDEDPDAPDDEGGGP
ncbi:MAG: RnfABCDGE type electron transport complex subunit G [Wenzhouxiangellaceae bacterium]|nr:RnfABCDGE type electron transport complex subunit G [Wenzhouxiangellaceae bacterium]